MTEKDGERLAVLEAQMAGLEKKMEAVDKSINALHTKMDSLTLTLSEKYVSKDTFDEFKKNRMLERTLTVLVTATITALVMFYVQKGV